MPEGFHEYGTFGKKTVYLYHFPMFGSIHAYQVLVEADLSVGGKKVNDVFFAAKKANPEVTFVTSPAKVTDGSPDYWVLPDYSKPGAVFNARIHYRISGKDVNLFDSVQVTVKKVLLNRLLKSTTSKPPTLQYLYFGGSNEAYLLHLATWDPDFDQVIEVSPVGLATGAVNFDGRSNTEMDRLKVGDQVPASSVADGSFSIRVSDELFEFKIGLDH